MRTVTSKWLVHDRGTWITLPTKKNIWGDCVICDSFVHAHFPKVDKSKRLKITLSDEGGGMPIYTTFMQRAPFTDPLIFCRRFKKRGMWRDLFCDASDAIDRTFKLKLNEVKKLYMKVRQG